MPFRDFPYLRFFAALLLGGSGGWLFARLNLPLPWMLGSMTACTLGAITRAPIAAPAVVRPPMTMVIGVLLGAGFAPEVLDHLGSWIPTLIGLVGFLLASGVACVTYFRKVAGFDPVTAFFAGMPGGLVEMVVVGEEKGGDGRIIALIHSARILLIVFTLPFVVQLLGGAPLGPRASFGGSLSAASWTSLLWLAGTAAAGGLFGHVARLPARFLLGPMLVSAAVHLSGASDFRPPGEIVSGAQIVLGTTIGCRFVGTEPREILRITLLSLGSTAILLGITVLSAVLVAQVSDYGIVPIVLAYSPGGLAEMSLIAVALHIEVAFVAAHHIARVLMVMVGAAPVFRRLTRAAGRAGP